MDTQVEQNLIKGQGKCIVNWIRLGKGGEREGKEKTEMAEIPGQFLEQKETDEELSKRDCAKAQDTHESCIIIVII